MDKKAPPNYDQSENMLNPTYGGSTYPNSGAGYSGSGVPYPPSSQQYPTQSQQYPPPGQQYPCPGQQYPATAGIQYPATAGMQYPGVAGQVIGGRPVFVASPGIIGGVPMMVTTAPLVGPHSTNISCHKCGKNVMTSTTTEPGFMAYLACGLLFVFGCVFGCCLIPFCMESCQDVNHFCPECRAFVGKYSRR